MSRCALINLDINEVENIIVASDGDDFGPVYLVKANPPDYVTVGTKWLGTDYEPPPPVPNTTEPVGDSGLEAM